MICTPGTELLNDTIAYLRKLNCIKAQELAAELQKVMDTPHKICSIPN
jgi:hypothetical protein